MSTAEQPIPACLTRDRLASPYFPQVSAAGLAAIAALAAVFLLTSFHRLNHTDLWCHVVFGRWIAEHQALPAVDPFTAETSSVPVLQAAWLSQLVGYEVEQLFGNEGLIFGHALLVTLTAAALMRAVYRRGAPAAWVWTAGAVMFVLDLPIVGTIRPQLFGQLGAALFLLAAANLPERKHPLIWIPLVAALWANLHGSIAMGLAILGIFAVDATWNAYYSASGKLTAAVRDSRLGVAWAAVLLALMGACLNPHGPMLLVRTLLFNDHAALASVSEWRALTPGSLTGILMMASVAVTFVLVKYSPRKWTLSEILLLVVFGLATLPAIRMLAWWAVVWPVVCIPHAAAAWRKYRANHEGEPVVDEDAPTGMRTVLAMGVVFTMILVAPPTYSIVASRSRGEGLTVVTDTPLYVATEIVRRDLAGNIAAPMDWADFLVWKTDGKLKPLVHSHVHLADLKTWRDYETIFRGGEEWLKLLQDHHLQYIVVPGDRFPMLAKLVLKEDRGGAGRVRIIYQDQKCLLAEVLPTISEPVPATGG